MAIYFSAALKYNIPIDRKGYKLKKGVMLLGTRERILVIRLLDKVAGNPNYAKVLGIECVQGMDGQDDLEEPP